jgi:hypothetical protein
LTAHILQLVEDNESQLRQEVASSLAQLMQTLSKAIQDFEAERLEMSQVHACFSCALPPSFSSTSIFLLYSCMKLGGGLACHTNVLELNVMSYPHLKDARRTNELEFKVAELTRALAHVSAPPRYRRLRSSSQTGLAIVLGYFQHLA